MRHSIVRLLLLALILTQATWAASAQDEPVRSAADSWIPTPGNFDAFVDFEAANRDPANPKQFLKVYDSTDNLHPNEAGYEAMADAGDLSIFTRLR